VSNGGGLGPIGGGRRDWGWIDRQLETVVGATDKPGASASSPGRPSRSRPSGVDLDEARQAVWASEAIDLITTMSPAADLAAALTAALAAVLAAALAAAAE
jgi:hypothetical protein